MSGSQTLLVVLVLGISTVAFSQTDDTKPSESGGPAERQTRATVSVDPCESDANQFRQSEILTDTMGVDFRPYLANVMKTVRQNWFSVMPPSVYPPARTRGKVSIEFVIRKEGNVDGERLETSSGDVASPFAPLPKEFPGPQTGLRLYFFYNLDPDSTRFHISPCIDVRVPVGSTLRFSAPIGGIERAVVTWSVSGPACEKAACGTISENGLYTAPADVPDPAIVFVEAKQFSRPHSVNGCADGPVALDVCAT
jgi:hypothetical protein